MWAVPLVELVLVARHAMADAGLTDPLRYV